MKIRVLGCSGGIGSGLHSTSFLIDDDILIDAGTGINELSLEEMTRIRHIFLTHTHLDHIACLPLMVDSIFSYLDQPIVIHGQGRSIEVLKKHIFNWDIWPDFASLPADTNPVMCYHRLEPDEICEIDGRTFEMIPVNHIVPTVGYRVASSTGAFAFSGDTTTNETLWATLNRHDALDLLIVEVAFSNEQRLLSSKARHYCPSLLAEDIVKLRHQPRVYLTHNKPGYEERILDQCRAAIPDRSLSVLSGNLVLEV